MGNDYSRALSERATLIAARNTWIEGAAIQQLETASKLQGMQTAIGLPDLHPGRGYPVGAAFFTSSIIYPALIGGDVGCGMQFWQTDIKLHTFKLNKLEKQLKSIDEPLTDEEREQLNIHHFLDTPSINAPGTIGGGNHFAEIQQVDTVYQNDLFESLGLNRQQLTLLVHSGSRGLGGKILANFLASYGHTGIKEDEAHFKDYINQHNHAIDFAKENRLLIALRLLKQLKAKGSRVLDLWHNGLEQATFKGVQGWLHRKGAAPANQGVSIIPGSRGDYSYLVEPLLGEQADQALRSIAHGAGRKWMRSECQGKLRNFQFEELKRSELGSRLICDRRELVFEEAPQAYKSIDTVIEALEGAGLIRKIARFKPVLTYKCKED